MSTNDSNLSAFENGNSDGLSFVIAVFYFIIAAIGLAANAYTNFLMRLHRKTHFKNPFALYAISLTFADSATLLEVIFNG